MSDEVVLGRNRRRRGAAQAASLMEVQSLRRDERELLIDWARGSASQRRWTTLRALAGLDRLELSDRLLESLIERGMAQVDEQRRDTQWWPQQLIWLDLPQLQAVLGLRSQADDDAEREGHRAALRSMESEVAGWVPAALALASAKGLTLETLRARTQLLIGLATWCAEQRRGMRQDFALHARADTKDIAPAEWTWLTKQFDLEALNIEPFAPVCWLACGLSLQWDAGHIDAAAVPFIGIPAESFATLRCEGPEPQHYWLVENRACFERQARHREAGVCLLWLPGRPSKAWEAAVAQLLTQKKAPARISADADPAGIEIALTAGALWAEAGAPWEAWCMEPHRLASAKTLPLNTYDRQTLARLKARVDLPDSLRSLAEEIEQAKCKAEQEGWL